VGFIRRQLGRQDRAVLPAEVARALDLGQGERLLAWSSLVGGGAAAATMHDLRIVTPRGRKIVRDWVAIDHAVWEQDSSMLVIWWVDTRTTTPLEIQDDVGRLPEVVRERVQASVVLTASVPLPGSRAPGRVALRRTRDGSLTGQSLVPPGVKADTPDVARRLTAGLAALWSEAGDEGLNRADLPTLGPDRP
jgi:hypothetical protein